VRKTAVAVGTSLFMCLATALPALADSSLPQPNGGPNVLGSGGTASGSGGGTAFTGSNISWAVVALAVLVIVGLASLVLQRRRAAD
jgi:hypothetical protein